MKDQLMVHQLTNQISAFALLFTVWPINTLMLFKKLQNVMKNGEH
jgi:hypothetical protein